MIDISGIWLFASLAYAALILVSSWCGCKPWQLRTTILKKEKDD